MNKITLNYKTLPLLGAQAFALLLVLIQLRNKTKAPHIISVSVDKLSALTAICPKTAINYLNKFANGFKCKDGKTRVFIKRQKDKDFLTSGTLIIDEAITELNKASETHKVTYHEFRKGYNQKPRTTSKTTSELYSNIITLSNACL